MFDGWLCGRLLWRWKNDDSKIGGEGKRKGKRQCE